jgi:hypothetical protein
VSLQRLGGCGCFYVKGGSPHVILAVCAQAINTCSLDHTHITTSFYVVYLLFQISLLKLQNWGFDDSPPILRHHIGYSRLKFLDYWPNFLANLDACS